MEQNERLRNAFGHGGMVSAAENIFRDLDENGILRTLIHGADYNSQRWVGTAAPGGLLRGPVQSEAGMQNAEGADVLVQPCDNRGSVLNSQTCSLRLSHTLPVPCSEELTGQAPCNNWGSVLQLTDMQPSPLSHPACAVQ